MFDWVVGAIPSLADFIILLSVQPISLFRSTVLCYTFSLFPTKHNQDRITASQVICMSLVWIVLIYTYCRVLFTAGKAISKGSANKARSTILLHGVQLLLCMLSYITPVMDMFVFSFFSCSQNKDHFLYLSNHKYYAKITESFDIWGQRPEVSETIEGILCL